MVKVPYLFKLFILFAAAVCFSAPSSAQKELKQLKSLVRSKKSAEAIKEATRLMQDTIFKREPLVYAYAFSAHEQTYEQQNEKMYLGQKADSSAYFAAVRGMYDMAMQCEKYETDRFLKQGQKYKHRLSHASTLRDLTPNLLAAARYSYSHGQYFEAEEAAYLLLRLVQNTEFWEGKVPSLTPLQRQITSMIHVQGNYKLGLYDRMFMYANDAVQYMSARAELLEELAVARLMLGDSLAYCDSLNSALREFPERISIYDRLAQFYLKQNSYSELLYLAQSTLDRINDSHTVPIELQQKALEHKAFSQYNMQQFEDLDSTSRQLLEINEDHIQANFYLGILYTRKAELINVPLKRTNPILYTKRTAEKREWYKKALIPMEKYRKLRPNDTYTWAPRLYNIYLALNMGKEFEEISKIQY